MKNGSNLIVLNEQDHVLLVRQDYGEYKWMLPGGGIEEGETPIQTAVRETQEETSLCVAEKDMRFISRFIQRKGTTVHLYATSVYHGVPRPQAEIAEARFVCVAEIQASVLPILLGYQRMIAQYVRCQQGLDSIPHEGRLFEEVLWPLLAVKP